MFAVGYAAQTAAPDGSTLLVLENGRAISLSASSAGRLNEARQRDGQPAIPVISHSEAQDLMERLARRDSGGGESPGDSS